MLLRMCCVVLCGVSVLFLLPSCGGPEEEDLASVVQAFYDAASAEDVEAFMALVANDAEIEWGRQGLVTGKQNIRRQAEALFRDFDFTFILSDFQVDGNRVTFSHKMVLDDTQVVVEECADAAIVEGGQIKSDRIITCEYPE